MGRRRPKKRPPRPSESEDKAGKEEGEAFTYPVGAEVEVRTDEPGFNGSFYEATVTGHLVSSRGDRRYTLAYSTLLAEEGGPLKATADVADVRPRPPPQENAGAARREFAICEMVEAFHNDGWWAGVVSAAPTPVTGDRPRRVYEVTFPNSREIIEFEKTALRPHRVFEDGRWVPAAEVDNVSPLFSEGSQIEVSRAENFGESWSPATVLEVIGAHLLVQYRHIEKNGELATAIVDSQYIRPARVITSMGSRNRFPPSSHVEVLHQGSWWPGVIVKVLGSGINKEYVVKLKNHETYIKDMDCVGELKVENTQLRPRYDWDGKKWVLCIKKKPAKGPAKGHRLTARKRPISASLALHDEGDGSCPDKKLNKADVACRDKNFKKADVVSESTSPFMSVREKYEINHKSCFYPEETMEQQNAVLALGSQIPLPSLASMTAPGHLSSSSLALSFHLEQSSQMIKGPFLGTRSRNSDWSKIVSTDQEKQSTVGSRTDLSRQKEECVLFQTPEPKPAALHDEGDVSCRDKKLRKKPIYASLALRDEGDGSFRDKKLKKADVACRDKNLKKADVVSESISPLMSVREDYEINHKSCSYPEETMEQQNVVLALGYQFPLHSLPPMTAPGDLSSSSLALSCHLEKSSQMMIVTSAPQGPFLGTRSRNSEWSKIVSTDQEKQSTVGSRTDLSRQKEQCVDFPTPDAVGKSTETLQPKKGITAKSIEEDYNNMAIFEDLAQLPNDMIAGCEMLSEMNKVSCIDLTPRKDIRGSQESSGIHDLQQGGCAGETSAEQDTGEDLCWRYFVMPGDDDVNCWSSEKSVHDDQLSRTAMVECRTGYVTPAEVVSPATLDGVVSNPLQSGVNLEVNKSHTEELSDRSQSLDSLDIQRLPFVKKSPIWAELEALEIFKKMPQRPHFHQLQQYFPDLREGMALGLMLSFANLAESISRLDVQDDSGPLEQKMLGLSLLEANGFDVRDMRSRLETLLHAKEDRSQRN